MARRGDNIRKRSDGRWEGRLRCVMQGNNGQGCYYKYKSVYGKSYSEVKEKLAAAVKGGERKAAGRIPVLSSYTEREIRGDMPNLGMALEEWLMQVRQSKKHSTYVKYWKLYEVYVRDSLYDVSVDDITNNMVHQIIFQSDHNKLISDSLKHSIIGLINQGLQYASDNYGCSVMKLKNKVSAPKYRPAEIISRADQAKLINFLYTDMNASKMGILLCLYTGLRLGEICSLKWEDIDFNQMIIHINRTVQRIARESDVYESSVLEKSKTALLETSPKSPFSKREIPFSEEVKRLLRMFYRKNEEYVIAGNRPFEPRTYQNHFKKYLSITEAAECNFHALRHTFATNCIDNGMDVKSLSEILGHSNVQITLNRYVHPTMDTKRKYMDALSAVYGQYCGQG